MAANDSAMYFRKGFGLKADVQETLATDYSGRLVDLLQTRGYALSSGDVTVRLAREFGFCYGVERAVEYAYQTRTKFPDRRILLVGEIIHNPHVNARLREMGIEILIPSASGFDYAAITPEDVVILPAFGVPMKDFQTLRAIGVRDGRHDVRLRAQRVEARRGVRARRAHVAHPRQALSRGDARDGVAGGDASGRALDRRARHGRGADRVRVHRGARRSRRLSREVRARRVRWASIPICICAASASRIRRRCSRSESLAIGEEVGKAIERARGTDARAVDFRSFDTICSATQDRQDAVKELLAEPLDVMVVVGGYNSSNTISLAAICAEHVTTYHIEDAEAIDPEHGTIRYKPIGRAEEVTDSWMPAHGAVRVGLTAGASTPNNKIGDTVARVFATRGIDPATIE